MIPSISHGRRWASALAVSALAAALALPAIAIAAPPEHSNAGGVSDCIVVEQGGSQTAGNAGNTKDNGAVVCKDDTTTSTEANPATPPTQARSTPPPTPTRARGRSC
jgi:hypothetical protein